MQKAKCLPVPNKYILNNFTSCKFYQTSADSTVHVLSLSGFCPDFPENRVRCLSAVWMFCQVTWLRYLSVSILSGFCPELCKKCCPSSVCPDFSCLDSVRCSDSVRILEKKTVCCLSVRPEKNETELSGPLLSMPADVWVLLCLCPSKFHRLKTDRVSVRDSRTYRWLILDESLAQNLTLEEALKRWPIVIYIFKT